MGRESWQSGHRDLLLQQITENGDGQWDILVAGGGITGAGIAREAARRGLKVLLVDRRDFAWGTSSRSSKMVHGGLRYLASGDIKTTMHSVTERERLLKEAPGLVDPLGYLMAHYKGGFPGPRVFNALLRLYDFFAGQRYRKFHNRHDVTHLSPLINEQDLLGATQYADAITDDSRLVIRVLQEARKDGAVVINYMSVDSLIKENGQVTGAQLQDTESGQQITVNAKVVINATGAWGDELRGQISAEQHIRPARGSHIVVPGWRLPVAQAYTVMHPDDKRPIFIYPWEGRTVIGTTDLDHGAMGNHEVAMSRDELEYLIQAVCYQFPKAGLTEQDVIASWAGVRPLVSSGALNPSKEKRDHSIWNDNGLLTISGGKLTTFRLIALDVLRTAAVYLPDIDVSDTGAQMFTQYEPVSPLFTKQPGYLQKRIRGHYGPDSDHLLAQAGPGELEVIPGTRVLWAELRWSAGQEAVVHLDDLLLRRTRLGLLLDQGGLIFEDNIKSICQQELGWSEQQWQQEVARYQSIWSTFYSIPQ